MDELENVVVHAPSNGAGDVGPKVAVGVDIGATLAKLAIRDRSGALHFESLPARETELIRERVTGLEPVRVGLTGGGATPLAERLSLACEVHDEFAAWGDGARHLLEGAALVQEGRNLLVSLGTGTSVLLMDGPATVRIGGTALGGGTILGLSAALLGTTDFRSICEAAQRGDRTQVDLVVGDIYRPGEIPLPDDLTAASFGKLASPIAGPGAKDSDNLAAAILGLVGENVGLIAAGLSYASQVQEIVFAGSTLHDNPFLREILSTITTNMGRTPVFLPNADYGGALGALLRCGAER